MSKRITALDLALDAPNGRGGYRWLYEAVRERILSGALGPGARLPATRDLAAQYGLSRGTIVTAFDQLKAEGYVESATGSGTFVSAVLPDDLLHAPPSRQTGLEKVVPARAVSRWAAHVREMPGLELRPSRAFRPNVPALDLFPIDVWSKLVARRLRYSGDDILLGCDALGYRPLRDAIAAHIASSRGVHCTGDQIVIVGGTQEALDLATRLFLDPGDRACIEDPGYEGARASFETAAATIVDVDIDEEGATVPGHEANGARIFFTTPGHQCPLGITMSLRRRLQLLEWARANRTIIFEDDYDGEYRYSGRPVPALYGLDRSGCVLFSGSFSKTLFPSLRLGYLVVPSDLVPLFVAAKSITNRHAPLLEQAALCDFITEGHFGRHLRRMREVYAERLTALLDGARERFAGLLDISPVEAGLQTAAWLPEGFVARDIAAAASVRDIDLRPLDGYAHRPLTRQGLQLGFAAVTPAEIRRGLHELAIALGG